MRQGLKRLGFGALGAVVFLAVWIGVAALGHIARFPAVVTDAILAVAGFATYVLYARRIERRAVAELNRRFAAAEIGVGFAHPTLSS
jgi:hypothetical protein